VQWVQASAEAPSGSRRIYNLGNHPDNAPVLARALAEPDTVLLHDANLHHAALALDHPDEAFGDGGGAARLRERGAWLEAYEALHPAIVPVLERQRLILVHSDYARETLRMRGVRAPIAVIPMGVAVPVAAGGKDACSIGLFGHIGANRRVDEILDGVRVLRKTYPGLVLKAVGATMPKALEEAPGSVVRRNLSDDEYFRELARTTVFLNLRYPVMGETSLTTLQAMALGTVCAVYDLGSYAELPDSAVLKVRPGGDWAGPVAELLAGEGKRRTMEAAAQEWVRERHAPSVWAKALWEALCGSRS
jgi:glycosyltransferase involved in cell wall biosynthesis